MLRGSASLRFARLNSTFFLNEKNIAKMRDAHNIIGANLTPLKQRHCNINGARASETYRIRDLMNSVPRSPWKSGLLDTRVDFCISLKLSCCCNDATAFAPAELSVYRESENIVNAKSDLDFCYCVWQTASFCLLVSINTYFFATARRLLESGLLS